MRTRTHRILARLGLAAISLLWSIALAAVFVANVRAAETMPRDAARYRLDLQRQAQMVWGIDAPVATFAAQIHTESRWQPNVGSPVGARGLAQFMPGTERWANATYPELAKLGGALNPTWSLRALVTYDKYLFDQVRDTLNNCERMAMTLSGYNGGPGWVQRDRAATPVSLRDRWFEGVERYNAGRSAAAFRENRAYPQLILQTREPLYQLWGRGMCHE